MYHYYCSEEEEYLSDAPIEHNEAEQLYEDAFVSSMLS